MADPTRNFGFTGCVYALADAPEGVCIWIVSRDSDSWVAGWGYGTPEECWAEVRRALDERVRDHA